MTALFFLGEQAVFAEDNVRGDRAGSELAHTAGEKMWWYNGKIDQSHFFDFEYAKNAFENFQDFEDLDNGYDAEFADWNEAYKNKPEDALVALESHPDKVKIMEAHDLQWAYLAWHHMVWGRYSGSDWDMLPGVSQHIRWRGWNDWYNDFCDSIKAQNFFNDTCIVPDWRTEKQKTGATSRVAEMRDKRKDEIDRIEEWLREDGWKEKDRQALQELLDSLKEIE